MTAQRSTTRWGRVPAWWLLHPGVDADRFCMLAALATYADEHGECVPSQATLAQRLQRSRPWVNRVIAQLAAEGLLEKVQRLRNNGGTSSCLYRLRLKPSEDHLPNDAAANDEVLDTMVCNLETQPAFLLRAGDAASAAIQGPDPCMTGGVTDADTPRHERDTIQLHLNQTDTPATPASAAEDSNSEVPSDWEPSAAEIAQAQRLCPDADLITHTARFRARCRARGYRYRPGYVGDAWLAWLLEDHDTTAQQSRRKPFSGSPSSRPTRNPCSSPSLRFAAWAAAAAIPVAPTHDISPWS